MSRNGNNRPGLQDHLVLFLLPAVWVVFAVRRGAFWVFWFFLASVVLLAARLFSVWFFAIGQNSFQNSVLCGCGLRPHS